MNFPRILFYNVDLLHKHKSLPDTQKAGKHIPNRSIYLSTVYLSVKSIYQHRVALSSHENDLAENDKNQTSHRANPRKTPFPQHKRPNNLCFLHTAGSSRLPQVLPVGDGSVASTAARIHTGHQI